MESLMPCLWFDNNAEEAVDFYLSIFKNSKKLNTARFSDAAAKASGRPLGSVMTIAFQLNGQDFLALNGGPIFKFSEAISFVVRCDSQDEIDFYWEKLADGGTIEQCGWLKHRYGLSWQVVPSNIGELLTGDGKKAERVMAAVLQMKKIDMNILKRAYDQ